MYRVDLHTHTRFFHGFDSRATAFDPIGARLNDRFAHRRGLDGFAVTNHDYRFDPDATRSVAIPGVEVSTTAGHLLVVGPDPPSATNPGQLTPAEAVSVAHECDCAAIVAHPFRNSSLADANVEYDAVEVNGKHSHDAGRVASLADGLDVPVVGGSDAHYPFELGRAYTRVDADALSPRSVVAAIRDGRVEPVVRETRFHRALRRLYARVHRWKGHVP